MFKYTYRSMATYFGLKSHLFKCDEFVEFLLSVYNNKSISQNVLWYIFIVYFSGYDGYWKFHKFDQILMVINLI
jgi:hypothetical protein